METYWVSDLPDIKGIAGYLWRSIFIAEGVLPVELQACQVSTVSAVN